MTPTQGIRFLSVENVLAIHQDTIDNEGGRPGIRDVGLLESAVAMPQSQFSGQYLHSGLAAMAAAYLFHLCQNHAFIDGNKRTAAFACLLFLYLNGVAEDALPRPEELERITLSVASSELDKSQLTEWLQQALSP